MRDVGRRHQASVFAWTLIGSLIATAARAAPTVWDGPEIQFSKPNNADPTDPANQDQLSPTVAITRGAQAGLYNAAQEDRFNNFTRASPIGTAWAFATNNPGVAEADLVSSNWAALNFEPWAESVGGNGALANNITAGPGVLHLVEEGIYLNLQFTQWAELAGGGFAYIRSTDPANTGPAGDYNANGQVEQGDLDLVLQNWGVEAGVAGVPPGWTNDLPAGQIEQTELDRVLQAWGNTTAPTRSPTLPEPAMFTPLAVIALWLPRRTKAKSACVGVGLVGVRT